MVLCFFRLCRTSQKVFCGWPIKASSTQHKEEVMDFLLRVSPELMGTVGIRQHSPMTTGHPRLAMVADATITNLLAIDHAAESKNTGVSEYNPNHKWQRLFSLYQMVGHVVARETFIHNYLLLPCWQNLCCA